MKRTPIAALWASAGIFTQAAQATPVAPAAPTDEPQVQADSLNGAVLNASPLVKQRQNLSFGVGMSWVFAVSETRVAARPEVGL